MRNKPKVIPITSGKWHLVASDEKSSRMIFGLGKQRFAFDFLTRVTELPPHRGDRCAPVVPLKKRESRVSA